MHDLKRQWRRKIMRLFMVGFKGVRISSGSLINSQLEEGLGGVILFAFNDNFPNSSDLKKLTDQLSSLGRANLLISVDQEGGYVRRLKEEDGFSEDDPLPSHEHLGQGEPEVTYKKAKQTAQMLKDHGINLNLAPCVDVNVNPNCPVIGKLSRSFHNNPYQVVEHAKEFARAHREVGVRTGLKHFPGHGNSEKDSHLGFTDISESWQQEVELFPFENLIRNHPNLVSFVMPGHLFAKQIDDRFPVSLSETWLQGHLRGRLNYQGAIISDDFLMGAILEHMPLSQAVIRGLKAGIDLIILRANYWEHFQNQQITEKRLKEPHNQSLQGDIVTPLVDQIIAALQSGDLLESNINQSHQRLEQILTQ